MLSRSNNDIKTNINNISNSRHYTSVSSQNQNTGLKTSVIKANNDKLEDNINNINKNIINVENSNNIHENKNINKINLNSESIIENKNNISFDTVKMILKSIGENNTQNIPEKKAVHFIKIMAQKLLNLKFNKNTNSYKSWYALFAINNKLPSVNENNNQNISKQFKKEYIFVNKLEKLKYSTNTNTKVNNSWYALFETSKEFARIIKSLYQSIIEYYPKDLLSECEYTDTDSKMLSERINKYISFFSTTDSDKQQMKNLFSLLELHLDINKAIELSESYTIHTNEIRKCLKGAVELFADYLNYNEFTTNIMDIDINEPYFDPRRSDEGHFNSDYGYDDISTEPDNAHKSMQCYSNLIEFIKNCYNNNQINKDEYHAILQYMLYNNFTELVSMRFKKYNRDKDSDDIHNFMIYLCEIPSFDILIFNTLFFLNKILEEIISIEVKDVLIHPLLFVFTNNHWGLNEEKYYLLKQTVYEDLHDNLLIPACYNQLIWETKCLHSCVNYSMYTEIENCTVKNIQGKFDISRIFYMHEILDNIIMPHWLNLLNLPLNNNTIIPLWLKLLRENKQYL